MDEIGIDLSHLHPKSFEMLADTSFDLIVTFSPHARHKALELTRAMAVEVEYWKVPDPSAYEGTREQRLANFRQSARHDLRAAQRAFRGAPGARTVRNASVARSLSALCHLDLLDFAAILPRKLEASRHI